MCSVWKFVLHNGTRAGSSALIVVLDGGLSHVWQTGYPFTVHAYPKSITCMAASEEELHQWVDMLMKPLEAYREEVEAV